MNHSTLPPAGPPPGAEPRPPGAGTGPASGPPPSESIHTPPRGARSMNVLRWVLFAGLLGLALVSIGSYVVWRRSLSVTAGAAEAKYYCPMHPSYTSARRGECPICGMNLEPIPPGGIATASGLPPGDVPGVSTVHLMPERVQMIGVRTAIVARAPLGSDLELVGVVTPDETALRRIQVQMSGWIQQLMVNRVGERIEVGDPLFSIYSPEIYQTQQEFLIEAGPPGEEPAADAHGVGGPSVARERLRLLGVPLEEIRRLERERVAVPVIVIRARTSGTVLERLVTEGQRVDASTPLFSVADLSRVWVIADLYERDAALVRVGDRVTFTADALPGRGRGGRIDFIYPTVTAETRTLKVRVVLDNRDGALKPGMFGRVAVAGRGGAALVVPAEALIDTGTRRYVFLARAGGLFEPRTVHTGARAGDQVQILSGVAEGDTVVASATFLIDSESRLKAAMSGMGAAGDTAAASHRH